MWTQDTGNSSNVCQPQLLRAWKAVVGTRPDSRPSTSALRPAASNAPVSRAPRAFLGLSTSIVGAASELRPSAARKLGCVPMQCFQVYVLGQAARCLAVSPTQSQCPPGEM